MCEEDLTWQVYNDEQQQQQRQQQQTITHKTVDPHTYLVRISSAEIFMLVHI